MLKQRDMVPRVSERPHPSSEVERELRTIVRELIAGALLQEKAAVTFRGHRILLERQRLANRMLVRLILDKEEAEYQWLFSNDGVLIDCFVQSNGNSMS